MGVEVVTKGAMVVKKGVMVEDVVLLSALIVMVGIIQQTFCWELYGKPSAHQPSFQVEESPSQPLPPTSRVVSIPEEEYNRLLSLHSNSIGSNSTATLAQQGTSTACLATQDPWVIDLGAIDHMTSTSGLLSELEHSSSLPNVTLADGSTTTVSGLGTANLNPNLSLFCLIFS